MKKVYLAYSMDEGCRYHRILSPARFLKKDLPVDLSAAARPDEYHDRYDAYLVHGLPVPETLVKMGEQQVNGKPFIWGVDDDFKSIPPWNPCKQPPEKLAAWDLARKVADWILVSTPHLATTFGPDAADKVVVAPNLLDLSLYPATEPPPEDGRPLTFLWSGSHTHLMDVQPVVDGVRYCLQKYGGKVPLEFVFFGQGPPASLLTEFLHKGVTWIRPVDLAMYWTALDAIRPHVVLAPLYPCDFNLSKSNIRVLEGWALSAAVVASPVGEYRIVEHGVDGLWAQDDADWAEHLEHLILDKPYRDKLAAAGRARVAAQFDWRRPVCRRPWVDAFARMLDVEPILEISPA